MIFTITSKKKFYASVEYDKKTRNLKLIKATSQAMAGDLANNLTQEFWVYDPRGGPAEKKPKDPFQAELFIGQALHGILRDYDITPDEKIEYGLPPVDPDVVY